MSRPTVSVIIPAFNCERYIGRAVSSALSQSYGDNIEVIVVDDASTDHTLEVLDTISDQRLRVFAMEKNHGPSYCRNVAIREAQGDWLALLDADDWYAPQRLATLLQHGRVHPAELIADNLFLIDDGMAAPWSTVFRKRKLHFGEPRILSSAEFVHMDMGICQPILRKQFIIDNRLLFDESLRYCEDFEFFLSCLLAGGRWLVVPEAYYYYRSHADSLVTESSALLTTSHRMVAELLKTQRVQEDLPLRTALMRRLREVEDALQYEAVTAPLKRGAMIEALSILLASPNLTSVLVRKFPIMIAHRLRRLLQRREALKDFIK